MSTRDRREVLRETARRVAGGVLGGALAFGVPRVFARGPARRSPTLWVFDGGARRAWLLDDQLVRRAVLELPQRWRWVSGALEGVLILREWGRGSALEWRARGGGGRTLAEFETRVACVQRMDRPRGPEPRWVRLEVDGAVVEFGVGSSGLREGSRLFLRDAGWMAMEGEYGWALTSQRGHCFRLGARPGILRTFSLGGRLLAAVRAPEGICTLVARGARRELGAWTVGGDARYRVRMPATAAGLFVDPGGAAWVTLERGGRLARVSRTGERSVSEPGRHLGGVRHLAWCEDVLYVGLWGALVGYRWPRGSWGPELKLSRPLVSQGGFSWVQGLRVLEGARGLGGASLP